MGCLDQLSSVVVEQYEELLKVHAIKLESHAFVFVQQPSLFLA